MGQPFAILRVEKVKSLADVGSRAAHNYRVSAAAAPHADPARRDRNRVLVGPATAGEVTAAVRARLEALPKFRKDATRAVEVLMTASPEFFGPGAKQADLRAWRDSSLAWLRSTWGADNIASAVLHLDEATPHIQALVVPVEGGKLRASHWLDGPAKLGKLQDGYAAAVAQLGLRRGEKRAKPLEYPPLRDFYRAAERVKKGKRPARVKLPERGMLGAVSKTAWSKLERDLAVQNQRLDDLEALRAGQLDQKKLDDTRAQLERLTQQIDAASTKLDQLTQKVEMADGLLNTQRTEFNGRADQVRQLDAAINERRAHLAELDNRIQARKNALRSTDDPPRPRERPSGA